MCAENKLIYKFKFYLYIHEFTNAFWSQTQCITWECFQVWGEIEDCAYPSIVPGGADECDDAAKEERLASIEERPKASKGQSYLRQFW